MYPENYKDMDESDRKAHWSVVLSRGMRWAGEEGSEEISIFDKKLIADLRAFDPEIDLLMPEVLTGLAVMEMEQPESFLNLVNGKMGTSYDVDKAFLKQKFPNLAG